MSAFVIIILILGGGAAAWFYISRGGKASDISKRLQLYGAQAFGSSETSEPLSEAQKRAEQRPITRTVERMVGSGKLGKKVSARLEQADLKWSAGEFVVVWAVIALIAALLGFVLNGTIGFLALGVAGFFSPWIYLGVRGKKRRNQFVGQLADTAQMMANSLRAGFSIIQSMEMVAEEGASPAKEEFGRVITEVKLGLPLDKALDHLLARMPSEDLGLAIVAINVQRQVGGNLADILMVIAKTVRERVRFQRDLRSLTAQARYSSWIITALPIGVAVILNFMDRPYESYLYTSLVGHFMLGAAVMMMSLGFFFLNRIASIEV